MSLDVYLQPQRRVGLSITDNTRRASTGTLIRRASGVSLYSAMIPIDEERPVLHVVEQLGLKLVQQYARNRH